MKKMYSFVLLATAMTAQAQQLDNSNFDGKWEDCYPFVGKGQTGAKQDIEPLGWNIANVAGAGGFGATVIGAQVTGANGTAHAVKLTNRPNPMKKDQIVPAYLTLGTPWNTAKGFNASNKDGGTFGGLKFTHKPDAVEFYYQRTSVQGSTSPATVIAYLWSGSWEQENVPTSVAAFGNPVKETMIDRDRNVMGISLDGCQGGAVTSKEGKLIASFQQEIKTDATGWTKQVYEFEYKDETAAPEKINIIFAANNYFDSANVIADNTLTVDEVKLVYYHALKSFAFDGQTYEVGEGVTEFNLSDIKYDASKFSFEKKGVGAEVLTDYDKSTGKLTVTVCGNDYSTNPESQTVYTIQFAASEAPAPSGDAIASIKIGGENFADFKADQTEYTLPYAYHPGIVFEGVAGEGYQMVTDGQNPAFYDNVAKTVTLKAKNATGQEVSYVFHFTDAVAGEETGDYKGGLLVVLTNAEGADSKAPLMSNETLKITNNSNGTVNLAIDNFSFEGLTIGDIFVSDIPVADNKISVKKMVRLTSYRADGTPNTSALGWTLGVLPLQVNVTLHPEADGKFAEASIDILTGETLLSAMFKNIHVDIVPFEFEASEPITAEKPWGTVKYYSFIKAKGYLTKASAKFLQLTNSYVNEKGVRIDRPMDYIDLTGATFEKGLKLEDIMTGAPEKNNTLIYVNATSALSGKNVVKGNEADELVLVDSVNFCAPKAFTAKNVQFEREFATDSVESVILPFAVPEADLAGTLYQLNQAAQDEVIFEEVHTGIRANQPYLIGATSSQIFNALQDVEVAVTPASAADMKVSAASIHHFGTYSALNVASKDANTFYELTDGQFVKADEATVAPFRAMLASDAATALEQLNLKLVQVETGIEAVESESAPVDVYTLDGKLVRSQVNAVEAVQGLAKGLYIVGGKKVIVR